MRLTYLLGAGASAKAIPTVTQIKRRRTIRLFAELLPPLQGKGFYEKNVWLKIATDIPRFYSFDTYARKEYGLKKSRYGAIKQFMKAYMIYEHLTKTVLQDKPPKENIPSDYESTYLDLLDERYYPWLLHFRNSKGSFPSNVDVATWNYDIQIPLVNREIGINLNSDDFNEIGSGVFPSPIFLNGCICSSSKEISNIHLLMDFESTPRHNFLERDHSMPNQVSILVNEVLENETEIKFSWEDISKGLTLAIDAFAGATSLVIIGYSFPLFNREYDKQLLKAFFGINGEKLRKYSRLTIYVQDINANEVIASLEALIESISGTFGNNKRRMETVLQIIPIEHTREFFVPHDFDPIYG